MAITCDQTGMSLELDRCIYTNEIRDSITLAFANENCTSQTNGDKFSISTPLDNCLTEAVVEGNEIVFKNTISVKYRYNFNDIVLNSDVNINAQELVEFWSFFRKKNQNKNSVLFLLLLKYFFTFQKVPIQCICL